MTDPSRRPAAPADIWLDKPAESPFTPPGPGRRPWLAVLLTIGGAGLIGASVSWPGASADAWRKAGALLVQAVRAPWQPAATPDVQARTDPGAPAAPHPDPWAAGRPVPAPDVPPSPARVAARKCVQNGHITFTDAPCPVGAQAQDLALPAPASAGPGSPATVTLYRCRNHEGGHFWSRTHCHRQGARVDRMTEVSADLSLAQQTRLAEQRRLAAQAGTNPPPAPPRVRVAQRRAEAQDARLRCDWIEQRIEHIDSQARQPQSGWRQDQLRSERQGLRQEQFSLRCQ